MSERSTYELELMNMIKVWIFTFDCANCMRSDVDSWWRYISPLVKEDDVKGTYPAPPTIWCGCNEMLYAIESHGLYDLLESLYDKRDENIIIKLREPVTSKEQEESFNFMLNRE